MNRKMILITAGSLIIGVVAGTGLMMNDQAYRSVKQVVASGATDNSISNIGYNDISNMDIETAMMAVQSQRASLLDQQLKEQIASVQERNNQIALLNNVLFEISDLRSKEAVNGTYTMVEKLKTSISNAGINTNVSNEITVNELDVLNAKIKGQIDSLSNSQQMDMLRMQSLTNKRNEAFDVMTNFVKKMQESRSSIIGNMR